MFFSADLPSNTHGVKVEVAPRDLHTDIDMARCLRIFCCSVLLAWSDQTTWEKSADGLALPMVNYRALAPVSNFVVVSVHLLQPVLTFVNTFPIADVKFHYSYHHHHYRQHSSVLC